MKKNMRHKDNWPVYHEGQDGASIDFWDAVEAADVSHEWIIEHTAEELKARLPWLSLKRVEVIKNACHEIHSIPTAAQLLRVEKLQAQQIPA